MILKSMTKEIIKTMMRTMTTTMEKKFPVAAHAARLGGSTKSEITKKATIMRKSKAYSVRGMITSLG
jgi:hypothetical protein